MWSQRKVKEKEGGRPMEDDARREPGYAVSITGTSGFAGILASHQEGTLNPDSAVAALVTGIER